MNIDGVVDGITLAVSKLLPVGFTAESCRGELVVSGPKGKDYLLIRENIRANLDANASLSDVIQNWLPTMLEELQDLLTTSLGSPWPADPDSPPAGFATPIVHLDNNLLRVWFESSTGARVTQVAAVDLGACLSE